MKTKLTLLITFIIFVSTYAQNGFQDQIISTDADHARSVYAADIDGDGDMDALSASRGDDKIAWYENTDGLGSFGPEQIISSDADHALSVYATDIDGDGDMDVLSASENDDKIAWYENTDGLGSFGPEQIITTDADHAISVYAADIDGDGDMDVLSASEDDNKIAWYENTDGLGSFGPEQIITTDADHANSVYAIDIDGDGDMDVLSASREDDKIAWYENTDGLGSFGPELIITTEAEKARSVYATDLDGDGDMDVLSASEDNDKIAWYENTDGLGNFGPEQIISTDADHARSVYASDIDGDGNMDVLSASRGDDKIAWYKNLGILVVNQNTLLYFSVYPNPTTGILIIKSDTNIVQIEIHNNLGQLVLSNSDQNKIDISNLSQGLYFIKIKDENGNFGSKKVVKN